MTLKEAYEKRRLEVLDLQKQVKTLQKQLEQASSGLYVPSEKAALLKQINHLTQQVKTAEQDRDHYRDLWNTARNRTMFHDFKKLDLEEENEAVTAAFLKRNAAFSIEGSDALPGLVFAGQKTFWPHRDFSDGFFICRMRREN